MNENTPIPAEDRFAAASHSADVAEGLAILARQAETADARTT